jgi:hypothetical protein
VVFSVRFLFIFNLEIGIKKGAILAVLRHDISLDDKNHSFDLFKALQAKYERFKVCGGSLLKRYGNFSLPNFGRLKFFSKLPLARRYQKTRAGERALPMRLAFPAVG